MMRNNLQSNERKSILAQKPTEGVPFNVNPKAIDRNLFLEPREDQKQEKARMLIEEALDEVDEKPEKYGREFKTTIPKKNWRVKSVEELENIAKELGDHQAIWIEQALEWAQRITNGETWEEVCNIPDTSKWYRLVIWKNGFLRFVGGATRYLNCGESSTDGTDYKYHPSDELSITVPLIVSYK